MRYRMAHFVLFAAALSFFDCESASAPPQRARNMKLEGHHDLQGRSSYQPVPHRYGDRWILFVGHHAGEAMNPQSGVVETNGMSILDVTDPRAPVLLHHEPPTGDEASGTQHVQVCDGSVLPNADDDRVYVLRTNGQLTQEILDVTDPAQPKFVTTILTTGTTEDGRRETHKNWWDCETGIAYLASTVEGWRVPRVLQAYDLSNPKEPRHIRDFALDGMQPGGQLVGNSNRGGSREGTGEAGRGGRLEEVGFGVTCGGGSGTREWG